MSGYSCDSLQGHGMTASPPFVETSLRGSLRREQPNSSSHSIKLAITLFIKRIFHKVPPKAQKDRRMAELRPAANHNRPSTRARLLRRPFIRNKKLPTPLVFTWAPPEFCYSDSDSDTSDETPSGSPDSPNMSPTWPVLRHGGEAPEPFVRPSAPEPFDSPTSGRSTCKRFSPLYVHVNSSIQIRCNMKSGKKNRTRAFTPLPTIEEEDGNSSQQSKIYQPVLIRLPRDISSIAEEEEEEEEENELFEGVNDSNLLLGQRHGESAVPIGHAKLSKKSPQAAAIVVVTAPLDIGSMDEDYEEGDLSFGDFKFPCPPLGTSGDIDRKQPLYSLNWPSRVKYSFEDSSLLKYQTPEYLYDVDDNSSPSICSDSSDSSL